MSALIVAAAVVMCGWLIASAVQRSRPDRARERSLALLAMFAPAMSAADADPRAILVWQPLANTARQLFPQEFAQIDAAAGGAFPFSRQRLEAAHAHWTAEWLAWERTHDSEYKLKAAIAEQELVAAGPSPILRARLDAIEREKLELYQRRYEEYVRIAKALHALI